MSSSVDKSIVLKDGRILSSTHNNFKRWMTDKSGVTIEVTEKYYNSAKKAI
jgi:hypothetical protein